MYILSLNAGSSSIKFELFNKKGEEFISISSGMADRLYLDDSKIEIKYEGREIDYSEPQMDHTSSLKKIIEIMVEQEKIIEDPGKIEIVGHRVVHGGEKYSQSVKIDEDVLKEIEACIQFAPLHNPANLKGIYASQEIFPNALQVAVFDTAFHQTLPEHAYLYGIPYKYYRENRIRRYGFHGTSHKYVAQKFAEFIGKPLSELNVITCHLGNGASIAAVQGGKSVDTSMGFTPLEGLLMGTRCGDIDPAVVLWLVEKHNNDPKVVDKILNKESGLLGVSERTNDCKPLEDDYYTDERAKLSIDIFSYRVRKYIGAYWAVLGRLDGIIFTGGIGENSDLIREIALEGMESMGVEIDKDRNKGRKKKNEIVSTDKSRITVAVIPTNEQVAIAKDCYDIYTRENTK